MTKDDIIELAKEADNLADLYWRENQNSITWKICRDHIFANLAAAAEREACALVCEELAKKEWADNERCATAIRARSQL
jgi:hypothetical protein